MHCGLNQGDALSPLLLNFALQYVIMKVQDNRQSLELNGLHQLLVYADDMKMLRENPQTMREDTGISLEAGKAIGLEIGNRDISAMRVSNVQISPLSSAPKLVQHAARASATQPNGRALELNLGYYMADDDDDDDDDDDK
ncbi:hypothetical protein ANN_06425 [Periplaneta americana]|uniref:Reverse transcriptase domain-containing protein n=1 Tax=Periplaneta americana TaxID=6978 RepID=A0ABQ8TE87_PERAM|nr:hypothetical protein ANN_06425 [Periplaneta americana]